MNKHSYDDQEQRKSTYASQSSPKHGKKKQSRSRSRSRNKEEKKRDKSNSNHNFIQQDQQIMQTQAQILQLQAVQQQLNAEKEKKRLSKFDLAPPQGNSSIQSGNPDTGASTSPSLQSLPMPITINTQQANQLQLSSMLNNQASTDILAEQLFNPDNLSNTLLKLQEIINPMSSTTSNQGITLVRPELQHNFRHARRLYVGNIPDAINQEWLTDWLYRSLEACGGLLEPGNPIIKTQIDTKQKFAFIELRSIEETTAMLKLDGIILWNRSLRVRRPTEYDKYAKVEGTRPVPDLDLAVLESIGIIIIPTQVEDGPNKIFLANLPTSLDEFTILECLKLRDYGSLKSFHLVKDNTTNESKGYAFFDYKDPSVTDRVVEVLNGQSLYGRTLTCKKSIQLQNQKPGNQQQGQQFHQKGMNQQNKFMVQQGYSNFNNNNIDYSAMIGGNQMNNYEQNYNQSQSNENIPYNKKFFENIDKNWQKQK